MLPLSLATPSSLLLPSPKTLIPKTLTLAFPPPLSLRSLSKPLRPSNPLSCSSPQTSPIQVADLVEKDYSFLESDSSAVTQLSRIVDAAGISETSRVLISFPTVGFVDQVASSARCELIVAVHESLFVLAMIKEGNDAVRCFQGGIDVVSKKFLPLDVVFVCYFPAMGISLDELMRSVAKRCSPGARLVISFDQGREIIEREHQKQHPDIVTSSLPDKSSLEKAAIDCSFQITEFVDEPAFYLAVLKLCKCNSILTSEPVRLSACSKYGTERANGKISNNNRDHTVTE